MLFWRNGRRNDATLPSFAIGVFWPAHVRALNVTSPRRFVPRAFSGCFRSLSINDHVNHKLNPVRAIQVDILESISARLKENADSVMAKPSPPAMHDLPRNPFLSKNTKGSSPTKGLRALRLSHHLGCTSGTISSIYA